MNQNEIDLLFGRICSASEKLHYLRNKFNPSKIAYIII